MPVLSESEGGEPLPHVGPGHEGEGPGGGQQRPLPNFLIGFALEPAGTAHCPGCEVSPLTGCSLLESLSNFQEEFEILVHFLMRLSFPCYQLNSALNILL